MRKIHRIPFKELLTAIILLTFTYTNGATYFVNSKTGNDANQGTSKENPWKGLQNLEKDIFLPGDSILFAD